MRVLDVEVLGSGIGPLAPRLVIDHPQHGGRYFGDIAVVSGFIEGATAWTVICAGDDVMAPVEVGTRDGAFIAAVERKADATGPWAIDVTAQLESGAVLRRRVHLIVDGFGIEAGSGRPTSEDLSPEVERARFGLEGDEARGTVTATEGGSVMLGERVGVTFPAGSVSEDTEVKVRRPTRWVIGRLNPGMINVTAPKDAFYRFLPQGARFNQPVTVAVPYERRLIPPGMGPQDVRTYYFDEDALIYRPLARVDVDVNQEVVHSLTDHFTDMINAVLVLPESPTPQSFNPNSVSDIAIANPAAGITLVAPPSPRSDGAAAVSNPFSLPPARGRYQPQLALSYTSEGGWGIGGEGWNLSTSAIEVDTRFGAPRYEREGDFEKLPWQTSALSPVSGVVGGGGSPGPSDAGVAVDGGPPVVDGGPLVSRLVGERYLWDGQAVVPDPSLSVSCAHGGTALGFRLRKEGRFAQIVRCGDDPAEYHWEITEKDGTRYVYGFAMNSRVAAPGGRRLNGTGECEDIPRNIGRWLLQYVDDADNNRTEYEYEELDQPTVDPACCTGVGCAALGAVRRELGRISYTHHPSGPGAAYEVVLTYAPRSTLHSPDAGHTTADEQLNAKLGFPVLRDQVLTKVEARCATAEVCEHAPAGLGEGRMIIRQWVFEYDAPAEATLYRTRLKAIRERGAGASE